MKRTILFLLVTMITVIGICGCGAPDAFRLHIPANSDSEPDQRVKLEVRDAILAEMAQHSEDFQCKEDAMNYVNENLPLFEQIATDVLADNGLNYGVSVQTGNFEFPEKTYCDVTYPAGNYDALRIVLGEGEGQNWWCVLFPTLCIVNPVVAEEEDVEVRSFFWDLLFPA